MVARSRPVGGALLGMLAVSLGIVSGGCGGGGSMGGPPAADAAPDASPIATCDPACRAPSQECVGDRCVCADSYHDGGDATCVAEGSCSPGFGLRAGEEHCLPLGEICGSADHCQRAVAWSAGGCEYEPVEDGLVCPGADPDPCITDFECVAGSCQPRPPACGQPRPVVFVHGVNGAPENYDTMAARLIADGWPPEYLFFFAAVDPAWGCNVDNAQALATLVDDVIATTCQPRVDLVAHSMGTLSSRYYVKNLGGVDLVNTYVTLGGQHHGLASPCWAPDFLGVCVWQELCETGPFIAQLNEGNATPGSLYWVSMYGTADDVVPNASSQLTGAELIEFPGVEHSGPSGLLEVEAVYQEVRRVLQYACW